MTKNVQIVLNGNNLRCLASSLVSVRLMMSTMPCRNAYQWTGKGRWLSLTLRKPKKKAGAGRKKQGLQPPPQRGDESDDEPACGPGLAMAVPSPFRCVPFCVPSRSMDRQGWGSGEHSSHDAGQSSPAARKALASIRQSVGC